MPQPLDPNMSEGTAYLISVGLCEGMSGECDQSKLPLVKGAYDGLLPEEKLLVLAGSGSAYFQVQAAKSTDCVVSLSVALESTLRRELPGSFVRALFQAAPVQQYHYQAFLTGRGGEEFSRRNLTGISYYVWANYVLPTILGTLGERRWWHGSSVREVRDIQGEPLQQEPLRGATMPWDLGFCYEYHAIDGSYADGTIAHAARSFEERLQIRSFGSVSGGGMRWHYEGGAYVDFSSGWFVKAIHDPNKVLHAHGPYEALENEVSRLTKY